MGVSSVRFLLWRVFHDGGDGQTICQRNQRPEDQFERDQDHGFAELIIWSEEFPEEKAHQEYKQRETQAAFDRSRGPGGGKPAVQTGVDDPEDDDAEDHGRGIVYHQRQRLKFRPYRDEFVTLQRWIKQDAIAVYAEPYESEGEQHHQVHGQTARHACEDCSCRGRFHFTLTMTSMDKNLGVSK